MASNFVFDGAKGFDDNFEEFLNETKQIDEELAEILRDNASALAEIVSRGERDSNARASFNAAIAEALDALVASCEPDEGDGA